MQQKDLFETPTAEIVAFPARRLAARIRYVAQQVTRKQEPVASKFFRCECSRLFAAYQISGLSWDEANEQIQLFAEAVQHELKAQHSTPNPKLTG